MLLPRIPVPPSQGESTSVCGAGTIACNLTGGPNVSVQSMLYRQERAIETRCRSRLCASHTMSDHSCFSDSNHARQRSRALVLESAGSYRTGVGHDHYAAIPQWQSSVVAQRRARYLSPVHIRSQGEAEVDKCVLGGLGEVVSVVLTSRTCPKPRHATETDNRQSPLSLVKGDTSDSNQWMSCWKLSILRANAVCTVVCIVAYTPPGNYGRAHTGSEISTNSLIVFAPSSSGVAGEAQCSTIPCTAHNNYACRSPTPSLDKCRNKRTNVLKVANATGAVQTCLNKVAPSRLAPFGQFPSAFCVFEVSPSASDYPDSALSLAFIFWPIFLNANWVKLTSICFAHGKCRFYLSPDESGVGSRTNAMMTHFLSPLWQRPGVPPSCFHLAPQRAITSRCTFRTRKSHQSTILALGDQAMQCKGQTSKTHDGNTSISSGCGMCSQTTTEPGLKCRAASNQRGMMA
ncbi:Serine/threonine-protein phosphatase 7 long form-like protein [Senna tora]|uniref:Serine/threonine-protein phosphatase 7 long form-like protein n=1 Tax=Senna tora TaxID=362788 RepID=A0A834XFY0_9FABA|nr:Serine/threonine-protein phosphatase 7 long form-like protein [Senna tora]